MQYTRTVQSQVFQDGKKFYLIDIYADGKITLKVKENGWGDIWSLPVEESGAHTWANETPSMGINEGIARLSEL